MGRRFSTVSTETLTLTVSEWAEYREAMRAIRLPVPGVVTSWRWTEWTDDGRRLLAIARTTGRPCADGLVTVNVSLAA
jgi:hypothetical protein